MITKSNLLFVALLETALLAPTNAAVRMPDECGLASVYLSSSEGTASGEDTLPENFSAAHRTLPFGTLVHVNNPENGCWAVVRITDRGTFISGRIIDVSQVAARDLGISSLAQVCLNILWIPEGHRMDPRKSTGRGKLIWRALAAVHHYTALRKLAFARYR